MEATINELKYLSWIYSFEIERKQRVTPKLLKSLSKTQSSSVTEMIQKLAHKQWVVYRPYIDVSIAEKGKKLALNYLRESRIWQTFLCNSLELNWNSLLDITEEFPNLSPELLKVIEKKLGYPRISPFGEPIPNHQLYIIPNEKYKLTEIKPREKFIITGLMDFQKRMAKKLDEIDVLPNTQAILQSVDLFDNSRILKLPSGTITIPYDIANSLIVKKNGVALKYF